MGPRGDKKFEKTPPRVDRKVEKTEPEGVGPPSPSLRGDPPGRVQVLW